MPEFSVQPTVNPVSDQERDQVVAAPVFGKRYTDHMAQVDYTAKEGWHNHRITGREPISLDSAAAVFHYGQEIFEGLKAYRHDDGSVWLFRPQRNAARFMHSAERLCMAPLPEEDFLAAVRRLVEIDHAWVPSAHNEQSLYIRPTCIATEAYLGVRPAQEYRFFVMASPSGAYYPDPVKLWVTPKYKRAAGTGQAKCGGNYAASLLAAEEAAQLGCGQVLYTDAGENRWVEECGTMNFMMVTKDKELVTPNLGNVLPGVTRESLLMVAPQHGLTPVERPISVDELEEGLGSGQITELLACGTAAVVTPIVGLLFDGDTSREVTVADGAPGENTMRLRQHLLGIQYGHDDDPHNWMERVI